MLHFSFICQSEFDIIIFYTKTLLALQISRVWLTNLYLILKLLVFASISQLDDTSIHLLQYYYFFLSPGLSYFSKKLFLISEYSYVLLELQQYGVITLSPQS